MTHRTRKSAILMIMVLLERIHIKISQMKRYSGQVCPRYEAFMSHVTSVAHWGMVTNPGSSPELQCPEFLLRHHHDIGMVDRIIGCMIELTLQLLLPCWYHLAQSSNPVIRWFDFLAQAAPILGHIRRSSHRVKNNNTPPVMWDFPKT